MSKIEVNTVAPQCGTTLTLGESGDTVQLGTGASQSGFGRTGTVDWDTTPKTATFTAVSGDGFFADTTSGAFNMNLPAGTAGAIVSVADYAATFQNNALTVVPNGSQKIGGTNANVVLNTIGQSVTFVYVDDTQGWVNVQDSTTNARGNDNLIATGGTVTECGDFKIHTFTGPGTFSVAQVSPCAAENLVSYMVVGGGGGGGGFYYAGGGGAGGYREVVSPTSPYTGSPLNGYPTPGNRITVTATSFPITVGGGGAGGASGATRGTAGAASVFSTISSAGGGGGGSYCSQINGGDGGSGGGGGSFPSNIGTGGSGNTPPVTPSQGNNGGNASANPNAISGGGGGAAEAGNTDGQGYGGDGTTTSINGVPTTRAGGGGGTGQSGVPTVQPGGDGGGGASGRYSPATDASAGTTNTGGGGGGGVHCGTDPSGGNGGSGVVIIRYKFK